MLSNLVCSAPCCIYRSCCSAKRAQRSYPARILRQSHFSPRWAMAAPWLWPTRWLAPWPVERAEARSGQQHVRRQEGTRGGTSWPAAREKLAAAVLVPSERNGHSEWQREKRGERRQQTGWEEEEDQGYFGLTFFINASKG